MSLMDVALRRGFFYPSSEIYGGSAGFYDFGHLGVLLKRKFENTWRTFFLGLDQNFVEIETCTIMPKAVFEGSGHLKSFNDPLTECLSCHVRHKADLLLEEKGVDAEGLTAEEMTQTLADQGIACPKCKGSLSEVRWFNMMFELDIGPAEGGEKAYLRPETAQGCYVSFKRMYEVMRNQIPMGLAIIGKAYRNEISPRQGFYRLRELNQAELQIFFDPDTLNEHPYYEAVENQIMQVYAVADRDQGEIRKIPLKEIDVPQFYGYYMAKVQDFYLNVLKVPPELFRFRELSEEERAFYNKIHWDMEVYTESLGGFKEAGGIHYRTDHDLSGHQKGSGKKMDINVEGKKFVPHVLELSFGVDRNLLMLIDLAYTEEEERIVLKFPRVVAPYTVAVFPLMSKGGLVEVSYEIYLELKKEFDTFFDEKGSIGKRYRRQDEIGTPICITVDYDTLEDSTVTVRDRDTMDQVRIHRDKLADIIRHNCSIPEFKHGVSSS
ncbi:MAG: glycine--tRNA ligase [Theionarchaea archaeon]|nr:glycine--tRNA ligase [Theionarchaea archaeon]